MSSPTFNNPSPQFGTAEFKGDPDRCQLCGQTLGSTYYRVGPHQACPACAEKAKFETPKDTHAAFVRGVIFGCGGALLGLIAYSTFGIVTGLVIGYLSLLVGYLVGKAIMKGSRGIGGRRYQIAAVLLTYAAVSMSAVPIGISIYIKQRAAKKKNLVQHSVPGQTQQPPAAQPPAAPSPQFSSQDELDDDDSNPGAPAAASSSPKPKVSFATAIGALLFAGLASPFLELQDPLHGVIGLIILAVGIRIAWRLTAGVSTEILGPFARTSPPPPSAG
jgi:hypothetical protein